MSWQVGLLVTLGGAGLAVGVVLLLRWWTLRPGRRPARPERRVAPDRRRHAFGWRSVVFAAFALVFATASLTWYLSQKYAAPAGDAALSGSGDAPSLAGFGRPAPMGPAGMPAPGSGGAGGLEGGGGVAAFGGMNPAGTMPGATAVPSNNAGGDLAPLVVRLKTKLDADPSSGDGWLLLARAYGQLQRYGEADAAYREAAKRLPPDADLLADWVDAHVMARQREWDGEARNLLKRALATNGRHLKALSLAGSEAFVRGDYGTAIGFWERLKAAAPAGSMELQLAEANLAEARRLRGAQP